QQHAMGKDNKHLNGWLEQMQLTNHRRLAELLEVEAGWEHAVETALAVYLDAVCIDNADDLISALQHLTDDSLTLIETGRFDTEGSDGSWVPLSSKVRAPWSLCGLLTGVYCAEDMAVARAQQANLKPHESIILSDGTWFGAGWLRVIRGKDAKFGVLQREKELRLLRSRREEVLSEISRLEEGQDAAELDLKDSEARRETLQSEDKALAAEYSAKTAEFSAQSARHEQQLRRLQQIEREIDDIVADIEANAETLMEAESKLQQAEAVLQTLERQREELEAANLALTDEAETCDADTDEARQRLADCQARIESLRSSETLTLKQVERLDSQRQQTQQRLEELERKLRDELTPMEDEQQALTVFTTEKEELETALKNVRRELENGEQTVTSLSEEQARHRQDLERQKARLDEIRFEQQESVVRQQTIAEQLAEVDADPEAVLKDLSVDAEEQEWKHRLDKTAQHIEKLGTINLSAIEEYQAQFERMKFLDDQHADLEDALATLIQAINKIDKESKQRFKETFDKINNGLQQKFPKLFGGGQAYLELTGQDLLETGVNIVARPPGKRNSSIHLLSGGEKALTAVALVFSIFELNPAPFCLLDEVDAPLDDANVGRFSQMVEEMSASVQFLFISHNKATMEIAQQLAGVTMKEPGVSRMVAVDIEEAVSLAES
ncbi:MAG: chromosome segregation protein SMC, partial [Gammaproteobacteria bacterium]